MGKTPNPPPPSPGMQVQEPVTPPPDVTLEPATPTPEIVPIESRAPIGPARIAPSPAAPDKAERPANGPALPAPAKPWSAQPTQPMAEEGTVPVAVEEVEFAEPDGVFTEDGVPTAGTPAGERDGDRSSGPPQPRRPQPPPARMEGRPGVRTAEGELGGPPASARPNIVPPAPPRRAPRPRPATPAGGLPIAAAPASPAPLPVAPGTPAGTPASVHPFLQPGATWAEALSQRPRRKRLKPWFEEAFDEDYLRTLPFMTPDQTLREVSFIKQSLKPPNDAELLDVGCGYGRHAIELGQGGYRVTGIDLSLPLLIRAADESQRRALSVNFVHADMREMAFENQFDGAYSFLTSFGYFDEEANLKVAASICRALRPGGRFLVDTINRDYIVTGLPTRVWWEGDGCVVLEEVDFNFQTSRLSVRRSVVFQDGRQVEHDMSIRAYSLHELGKLLRQAGFRVLEVSGGVATQGYFFGATSRSVIMLCEKPAD
jgi:SAM-dependent methyltransferase